jgi:hypothetical protein
MIMNISSSLVVVLFAWSLSSLVSTTDAFLTPSRVVVTSSAGGFVLQKKKTFKLLSSAEVGEEATIVEEHVGTTTTTAAATSSESASDKVERSVVNRQRHTLFVGNLPFGTYAYVCRLALSV